MSFDNKRDYHIFTFSYGRMALYAYLKSLNSDNDEVLITSYTCVVVANAIVASGNKPKFLDIEENSPVFNTENLLSSVNEKTKAIVVTPLFGYRNNLDEMRMIKEKYPRVKIILDLSHDIEFVSYDFYDAIFYAFGISKQLTTVFGGVLKVRNEYYPAVKKVLDQEFVNKSVLAIFKRRLYLFLCYFAFSRYLYFFTHLLQKTPLLDKLTTMYSRFIIDIPKDSFALLSSFEAEIGNYQLFRREAIFSARKRVLNIYQNLIEDCVGLKKIVVPEDHCYSHFNLLLQNRDEFVNYMANHGVEVGIMFDYAITDFESYASYVENKDLYPNSRKFAQEIVNLPLVVSEKEALKICKLVNGFKKIN